MLVTSSKPTVGHYSCSSVLCTPIRHISDLAPCNHEEADTRKILHIADLVRMGIHKILLRIVNTDDVVLAVAATVRLDVNMLWIAFWEW